MGRKSNSEGFYSFVSTMKRDKKTKSEMDTILELYSGKDMDDIELVTIDVESERSESEQNIEAIVVKAHDLDQLFSHVFSYGEDIQKTFDTVSTRVILCTGSVLESQHMGSATVNTVLRRIYISTNGEKVVAFAKPRSAETTVQIDTETGDVISILHMPDSITGEIQDTKILEVAKKDIEKYRAYMYDQHATQEQKDEAIYKLGLYDFYKKQKDDLVQNKASIAQAYTITPDDILLDGNFLPRIGIEKNKSPEYEYVISKLNDIFQFDVVGLTVIREEEHGHDIASVQAEVIGDLFTAQDFDTCIAQGPDHPAAKSIMRLACLQYIVQSLDGSESNLRIDHITKKVSSIDNALSLPLIGMVQDEEGNMIQKSLSKMRSLPIEIIMKHPQWNLDEESLEHLIKLHTVLLTKQAEYTYMVDLMSFIYKNKKIALIQLRGIIDRLGKVISHCRPPTNDFIVSTSPVISNRSGEELQLISQFIPRDSMQVSQIVPQ